MLPILFGSTAQWPWFTESFSILLGVLVIASVLVWAVRFIMERVFLIDLIDPLWSPRTTGPVSSGANLLMVTRAPLVAQFFHLENYAVIDLGAAGTQRRRVGGLGARRAGDTRAPPRTGRTCWCCRSIAR